MDEYQKKARFLCIICVCMFIGVLILQYVAHDFDLNITKSINTAFANTFLDFCIIVLTICASWLFWVVIALIVYKIQNEDRAKALLIIGALIITTLVVLLIKTLIARARPDFEGIRILVETTTYSFPSGHVARAFATLICVWYITLHTNKNMNILLFSTAVLAILTAYSRIFVGAHFLLDVIAGALCGVVCATFLIVSAHNKLVKKVISNILR